MPTRAAPTSDSRQLAMENTSLFGGFSLVMISDFDQLPPVTGPRVACACMVVLRSLLQLAPQFLATHLLPRVFDRGALPNK